MSVVAVRQARSGSRWAADSCATLADGVVLTDRAPKVLRLDGWGLVGGVGDYRSLTVGYDLLSRYGTLGSLCDALAVARLEGAAAWLLEHEGRLVVVDGEGYVIQPDRAWHAIGAGADVACGALACRASARHAVEVACEQRSDCAPPVKEWRQ